MNEQTYRALGWGIFLATVGLTLYWCLNQSGLAGFVMDKFESATGHSMNQLAWIITAAVLCIPGWMAKNYFEGLAWNAHVEALPPPDIRASARKSKYVDTSNLAAAAPKAVKLDEVAKGQEEFIATCPSCGNFFSAKKDTGPINCTSCGEPIPFE